MLEQIITVQRGSKYYWKTILCKRKRNFKISNKPQIEKWKGLEENLRIGFGIHDFFSSQDNNRELLLPFRVLLGGLAVNLTNNPTKSLKEQLSWRKQRKETCAYTYTDRYIVREREKRTWKSLGWANPSLVGVCHYAKLFWYSRTVLALASASSFLPPLSSFYEWERERERKKTKPDCFSSSPFTQ